MEKQWSKWKIIHCREWGKLRVEGMDRNVFTLQKACMRKCHAESWFSMKHSLGLKKAKLKTKLSMHQNVKSLNTSRTSRLASEMPISRQLLQPVHQSSNEKWKARSTLLTNLNLVVNIEDLDWLITQSYKSWKDLYINNTDFIWFCFMCISAPGSLRA